MKFSTGDESMAKTLMIEAKAPAEHVRRAYDLFSRFYGWVAAPLEREMQMLALERARVRPSDIVLEVGVGTGGAFLEIRRRVAGKIGIHGIDLSPRMLSATRALVSSAGFGNVDLREADARKLPFQDRAFDLLFNSYMLDLIPLSDLIPVLGEFRRVLKPGGRLVLLNMSKEDGSRLTWFERTYRALPDWLAPYVLGGCRPVLMAPMVAEAGFVDVERDFIRRAIPSEIVVARKPADE
ncbi:MAG: methyltransferase domain-containing protein [Planctomycetota bacterium]|nr:methyltransferase domain-containing protein [Planctomycetota bacterium]